MWSHFSHLLVRVLHGMPSLVWSNWAAWLLGIGVFFLSQVLVLIRSGWRVTLKRWKKNIGIGIIVAVAVYLFFFAWSTVQTIYDDHHDDVSRWRDVVNEKNTLKIGLTKRDEYIKTLESKTCPKCPAGASGRPAPQCWVHEMITGPMRGPSNNATNALIHWNYRIDCAGATFDEDDFTRV
jgi:hypothetical protein